MNKAEAIAAISASFQSGSNTPCPWESDPADYIARKQRELLELVIEPVAVAITGEAFSHGVKQMLASAPAFAIARQEQNWLLIAPGSNVFSLAHGRSASELSILGFSSSDALAEWLG
ncbi:MAG: hypothetical protein CFE46_15960 [Burkholderiales bacterium PBB6]|nr:MAG: hypothetical protein CFE46_15960 [Burkholderiales bacterium PBB6]